MTAEFDLSALVSPSVPALLAVRLVMRVPNPERVADTLELDAAAAERITPGAGADFRTAAAYIRQAIEIQGVVDNVLAGGDPPATQEAIAA